MRHCRMRLLLVAMVFCVFAAGCTLPLPTTTCRVNDGQLLKQNNWRWDRKSQNLIYAGIGAAISPAGGAADFTDSLNYVLYYVPEGCTYIGRGQDNWRWDRKSQNLVYAGRAGAISSAGGAPDFQGSFNYVLFYERSGGIPVPMAKAQPGWRWDTKSQHLVFSQNPGAVSAAGGAPDFSGSLPYVMEYE